MSEIGTYGSFIYAPTPIQIAPRPGEAITWDWLDVVGQFSQRFLKMATMTATVAHTGVATFNYQGLRCDYCPPFLRSYFYVGESLFGTSIDNNGAWSSWADNFVTGTQVIIPSNKYYHDTTLNAYVEFRNIGLDSAVFYNNSGQTKFWLFVAYL